MDPEILFCGRGGDISAIVVVFIFDLDTIGWWDFSVVFHSLFSLPSAVLKRYDGFPYFGYD